MGYWRSNSRPSPLPPYNSSYDWLLKSRLQYFSIWDDTALTSASTRLFSSVDSAMMAVPENRDWLAQARLMRLKVAMAYSPLCAQKPGPAAPGPGLCSGFMILD